MSKVILSYLILSYFILSYLILSVGGVGYPWFLSIVLSPVLHSSLTTCLDVEHKLFFSISIYINHRLIFNWLYLTAALFEFFLFQSRFLSNEYSELEKKLVFLRRRMRRDWLQLLTGVLRLSCSL